MRPLVEREWIEVFLAVASSEVRMFCEESGMRVIVRVNEQDEER